MKKWFGAASDYQVRVVVAVAIAILGFALWSAVGYFHDLQLGVRLHHRRYLVREHLLEVAFFVSGARAMRTAPSKSPFSSQKESVAQDASR